MVTATYNKFNLFTEDVVQGSYDFASGGATYSVMLTNTAPVATNHVYGDISANELANGNGYTTGGMSSAMSDSTSSGTVSVFAVNVTWTATGAVGPFRYAVVYNTSQTSPLKPLVCWFDYGSSVTMASGDTFSVQFDGTNGLFQMT